MIAHSQIRGAFEAQSRRDRGGAVVSIRIEAKELIILHYSCTRSRQIDRETGGDLFQFRVLMSQIFYIQIAFCPRLRPRGLQVIAFH